MGRVMFTHNQPQGWAHSWRITNCKLGLENVWQLWAPIVCHFPWTRSRTNPKQEQWKITCRELSAQPRKPREMRQADPYLCVFFLKCSSHNPNCLTARMVPFYSNKLCIHAYMHVWVCMPAGMRMYVCMYGWACVRAWCHNAHAQIRTTWRSWFFLSYQMGLGIKLSAKLGYRCFYPQNYHTRLSKILYREKRTYL